MAPLKAVVYQNPPARGDMTPKEFNHSHIILPRRMTPDHGVPITTLTGLLDLLDALNDELAGAPGLIPLLAITLRDELEGVLSYDR
jgi:hypothetical protein